MMASKRRRIDFGSSSSVPEMAVQSADASMSDAEPAESVATDQSDVTDQPDASSGHARPAKCVALNQPESSIPTIQQESMIATEHEEARSGNVRPAESVSLDQPEASSGHMQPPHFPLQGEEELRADSPPLIIEVDCGCEDPEEVRQGEMSIAKTDPEEEQLMRLLLGQTDGEVDDDPIPELSNEKIESILAKFPYRLEAFMPPQLEDRRQWIQIFQYLGQKLDPHHGNSLQLSSLCPWIYHLFKIDDHVDNIDFRKAEKQFHIHVLTLYQLMQTYLECTNYCKPLPAKAYSEIGDPLLYLQYLLKKIKYAKNFLDVALSCTKLRTQNIEDMRENALSFVEWPSDHSATPQEQAISYIYYICVQENVVRSENCVWKQRTVKDGLGNWWNTRYYGKICTIQEFVNRYFGTDQGKWHDLACKSPNIISKVVRILKDGSAPSEFPDHCPSRYMHAFQNGIFITKEHLFVRYADLDTDLPEEYLSKHSCTFLDKYFPEEFMYTEISSIPTTVRDW